MVVDALGRQQHLAIEYRISGSIFSTLSVEDLKVTPTGPGPIRRMEIGAIHLRYSLTAVIRGGRRAFWKELAVRDAFVEIAPEPPQAAQSARSVGSLQPFRFPPVFPEVVRLDNLNLRVDEPTGILAVEGVTFHLLPDRPGVLKISNLEVPGVRQWKDITAATTFRDRNLRLTDGKVGPEVALREFWLDLSGLENDRLGIGLDGTILGATVAVEGSFSDVRGIPRLRADVRVSGLQFASVWTLLNRPAPVLGTLEELTASMDGPLGRPREWTGELRVRADGLEAEGRRFGSVEATVQMATGRAEVSARAAFDERNALVVTARADLPETPGHWIRTPVEGRLEVLIPEAERLTWFMPEVVIGDFAAKTDFMLAGGFLKTRTQLDSLELSSPAADISQAHCTVLAEKNLALANGAPIFETLVTRIDGRVGAVRAAGYEAENLALALASSGPTVTLEHLQLAKATNRAEVSGKYILPKDGVSWNSQPYEGVLSVDAPDLGAFAASDGAVRLKGALRVEGRVKGEGGNLSGFLMADGAEIDFNGLPVRNLKVRADIADHTAQIGEIEAIFDAHSRLQADGALEWGQGISYRGTLAAQIADLGMFRPLLPPDAPEIGGALTMRWEGTGATQTRVHNGAVRVSLANGRVGEQKDLAASFQATYGSDFIHVPDFTAAAGPLGSAAFSLSWKDNRLHLTNLAVRQGKATLLTGHLEVPLHLGQASDPATLLPSGEPLGISLRSTGFDLGEFARNIGRKDFPLSGRMDLTLNAKGTLDDLLADLRLRATNLRSVAAKTIAPAEVSVDLSLGLDDQLRIDGTVRQSLIQPLRLSGILPFDAAAIKERQAFDPETPADLTLSLPRSSLEFVASLVPALRALRGTAEADVRVRGTVGQPDLSGTVTADVAALRFTDPSLPPVNALAVRLDFSGNKVTLSRCRGVVAGGDFLARGAVTFERLDNPILALSLGARNALVLQNDDLTVRVSSDLTLTGPLNAALAQGTVWVTRSRFFKNIDILPIGLPGRPAPQPPPEPEIISFRSPPLRDWKFDIAVKTLDPFLVQSNLARGRIVMDLRLGGTGLEPWLDGAVNIETLTATLPFSRLDIAESQVFFTPRQPFIPQLNIRGSSTIRDYDVAVFLSGTVYAPEAMFTSDPPLPQAEIVSLLATGMTTTELARDPNALAGRAALLLLQRTYNSVFRRGKPPLEKETFLNRIRFDIGVTDPKTGRQATMVGLPLFQNIVLMGGLDVGGNFQGQVKYLVRFK